VAPRRTLAVEWAADTGGLIVEDDYDGEFRYDRQPVGAMQALAPEHVVYAGTASKSLDGTPPDHAFSGAVARLCATLAAPRVG
jgi:hypothetical protein